MEKIFISVCSVFLMITTFGMAHAEENIEKMTIDRFIKTSETDVKLLNQKELTIYLENAPSSTPYIDRMEFRTKTEDFDLYKQKYSLRFYPKGWGETTYTKRVNELVNTSCRTEELNYYNAALKQRYTLVLDYLEARALIILNNKVTAVCEDWITVLKKKSAGSMSFDISDLISAEELLTELRLELVALRNKTTELTHQIKLASNSKSPVAFTTSSLITISKIKKMITGLNMETPINSIKLQGQKNKVDLANSKYKLEQAKKRDYLSFVQMSYDNDDYDEPKKAYSLEFAIKLPFIHTDRDEVNMRKMHYLKERLQYREEKKALSEKRISQARSLNRLIQQYAFLVSNKKNSNAEVSFKTYLKMDGMDPLNLLKIKESMIKSDIQLIKTGYNIRHRFIELMDTMGKLSEKPFRNYLVQ